MTHSARTNLSRPRRAGFTLIEMLTVITIIVLVLAMVVPVINSVVGNRSLEGGFNRLQAVINHARQIAIYNHAMAGVAFYIDPVTGRGDLAYVSEDTSRERTYPRALELATGEEVTSLPPGLGAPELINSNTAGADRYLSFGVILFDENGQLVTVPYQVVAQIQPGTPPTPPSILSDVNHWNMKQNLGAGPSATPPTPALYSSLALCLYDRQAFKSQVQTTSGNAFDDATSTYYSYFNNQIAPTDKVLEDTWLDQNGQLLVVKPNDGSLLKNQ